MEVPDHASVIGGRYRLESLIGEGGMAAVWRAEDLTLKRPVAVKLLYARDDRDRQRLVNQFMREARIAAAVQHRNVINIVDFGTTGEQQPYMVMELLEGESLGSRMHREPPLRLSEVVQIAGMTLRGLAAVHEAGIVHRDLKPDNIFLKEDAGGTLFPKILDFGISRSVEPRSGRRSALTTKEGVIVGTPEYMSPEQARGLKAIDRRTDIYSMGVILYEALCGQLPFASENVGDLIIQIVTGSAPTVRQINPEVPAALSDVVAKAMARRPEQRYTDASEMQQAWLAAVELKGGVERALSDKPPAAETPPANPKVSHDRLRTLEFPLTDPEPVERAVEAPPTRSSRPPAIEAPPPAGATLPREVAIPSRPPRRRARWIGAAAAASTAAAVALWLLPSASQEPVRGAIHGTAAPDQTKSVEQAPAETTPSIIHVSLTGVPAGARITIDGDPADGPELELPRDGKNRVIRVSESGRAPWQVVHHSSADAIYEVLLAPSEPVSTASPTAGAPKRQTATTKRPRQRTKPPPALRKLDF